MFVFLRASARLTALAFSFGRAAAPLERSWWVVGLRRLLLALVNTNKSNLCCLYISVCAQIPNVPFCYFTQLFVVVFLGGASSPLLNTTYMLTGEEITESLSAGGKIKQWKVGV